ncbi:MAG TPA: DUF1028 domain-containing protein [Alphaproteobacteria bacterium]|nr:DUF1028 domain-containing protein [Alphaproteobacteria bacterium]
MTFSIVGRCSRTGMVGIAISTSSIAVTGRCAWVRPKVGAVASQNVTDPVLAFGILDLMAKGSPPDRALAEVISGTPHAAYRQVSAIDVNGRTAHHSGSKVLGRGASKIGVDCVAAGNLLANKDIPAAMVSTFQAHGELHLGERLLRALEEGLVAGGEAGPIHSAGLIVGADQPWPTVNLRVDWADQGPIMQLRNLWLAYEPQMEDYVTRAVNPDSAPSFKVPGDP